MVDDGRLLFLFFFPDEVTYQTKETCVKRNEYIAQIADEIHIAYATPNGQLEKLKKAQGTNNALVRELRGVENLYNAALWMWLDYLKLTLCNADGAQYLTDEEIQIYNDIFPSLDIFTSDFCNGVYTNTKDPLSFSFSPDKLKIFFKGVLDSLEQIRHHVNLTYYQKNPSEIPELTKGKKKKQRK